MNADGTSHPAGLALVRSFADRLGALEIHYLKKENILFPAFEARAPRMEAAVAPGAEPREDPGSFPPGDAAFVLDAGALSRPVLDALFKAVPVDLTFVDAAGRVAWFSNGPHRVFPRSPSVIGRDVRNCHPRESVDRGEVFRGAGPFGKHPTRFLNPLASGQAS